MSPALRIGSLFSGSGALDLAVSHVLDAEPSWFCEYEPSTPKVLSPKQAAAQVLAHHWPGVPNHGDITLVDWARVEPVDVITGGWPCQPFSSAGKRRGAADERALWPEVARAIRILRPELVYLENVPAVIGAGELARAVTDLANIGYVGSWICLRASDVGAPHRRQRVFILAWRADSDPTALRRWPQGRDYGVRAAGLVTDTAANSNGVGPIRGGGARGRWSGSADDGEPAPDTHSERLERAESERLRFGEQPWSGHRGRDFPINSNSIGPIWVRRPEYPNRAAVADTTGNGRGEGWPEPTGVIGRFNAAKRGDGPTTHAASSYEPYQSISGCDETQPVGSVIGTGHRPSPGDSAEGVHELGGIAPVMDWGPYTPAIQRWERILGRPAPAPTQAGKRGGRQLSPAFCEWLMGWPQGRVTDVPGLTRNDQIKICGNGVVPQQAAAALEWLLAIRLRTAA